MSIPTRSLTFAHCGPRVTDGRCKRSRLSLFGPRACLFLSDLFTRCLNKRGPIFENGRIRVNASRCSGSSPGIIRGFHFFASCCVGCIRNFKGGTIT